MKEMKKIFVLFCLGLLALSAGAQDLSCTFTQKKTLKAVHKVIPGSGKVTFTAPVGGNDSTSVGDSTAVGDSTIAIHRTIMRDAQYRMQRDYNLKGCKVNARNRAQGAYYGRKVRVKE